MYAIHMGNVPVMSKLLIALTFPYSVVVWEFLCVSARTNAVHLHLCASARNTLACSGIIFHMVLCRKYRCAKNIRPHMAAHPGPAQLVCNLRSHAYIHAEVTLQSRGACAGVDRLQKFHPWQLVPLGPWCSCAHCRELAGESHTCGHELFGHTHTHVLTCSQ